MVIKLTSNSNSQASVKYLLFYSNNHTRRDNNKGTSRDLILLFVVHDCVVYIWGNREKPSSSTLKKKKRIILTTLQNKHIYWIIFVNILIKISFDHVSDFKPLSLTFSPKWKYSPSSPWNHISQTCHIATRWCASTVKTLDHVNCETCVVWFNKEKMYKGLLS